MKTMPRNNQQVKLTPTLLAAVSVLALGACGREAQDHPAEEPTMELIGPLWQWLEFQDSAEGEEASDILVADPGRYTLMLRSDNTADIQADCNRVSWTYATEGSRLTFDDLGPTTLAFCGEESLDRRYLERLANAATYVIADGKLYVNLRADAGNMVFAAAK